MEFEVFLVLFGARFSFADLVAAFFTADGLPFADVLTERRVTRVFQKHSNLFGRTYTTAIVLWAFMSQVLCELAR